MTCCCEKCKRVEWLQRAAEENGDGAIMDVLGYPAVTLQVFGDLSGGSDVEVQFLSGTDWYPIAVTNVSTGVVTTTGIITAEGSYRVDTTGLQKIKAEVNGYAGTDSVNVVGTAVCESGTAGSAGGGEGGEVEATIVAPLGRQDEDDGVSVTLSTQDKAALDLIDTDLDALNAVMADVHDASKDALRTIPSPSTTANTPAIVTAAASDALAANAARKLWSIQNLGTNPLFVRLGTGATTALFHFVLKAGSANDDGSGGFMSDEIWKGIVSYAGTSPRLVVTELT